MRTNVHAYMRTYIHSYIHSFIPGHYLYACDAHANSSIDKLSYCRHCIFLEKTESRLKLNDEVLVHHLFALLYPLLSLIYPGKTTTNAHTRHTTHITSYVYRRFISKICKNAHPPEGITWYFAFTKCQDIHYHYHRNIHLCLGTWCCQSIYRWRREAAT